MAPSRRAVLARGGAAGALGLAGCLDLDLGLGGPPGSLTVEWTSDTAVEYGGNHHAMATAAVDGKRVTAVPLNDVDGSDRCGVVAIDGSGEVRWRDRLPSERCGAHAIGDLGVGDLDGGGPEFLAATEAGVVAYDAATGEETFRTDPLESIGYTAPVVGDLDGDGARELVVSDFAGNVSVVRPDGGVAWTRDLDQPVFVAPFVVDLTGDGDTELAVNHGRRPGEVVCFDGEGEIVWRREREASSRSWSLVAGEAGPALVTTSRRTVELLEGRDGGVRWTRDLDAEATIGAVDGTAAYATERGGTVRALDLEDGTDRWIGRVTDADVRMPAPAAGRVDGTAVVAATAYDGTIALLDPASGDVLARRRLDADLYTAPVVPDGSGDGTGEVLVLYGDGRVAALAYGAD